MWTVFGLIEISHCFVDQNSLKLGMTVNRDFLIIKCILAYNAIQPIFQKQIDLLWLIVKYASLVIKLN